MKEHIVDKDKPKSNLVKNLILFFALIAITMFILFKDESPKKIIQLIMDNDKRFFAIGVVTIIMYHMVEALNLKLSLRKLGHKVGLIKSYKFTLIGAFFSGVTPAASGGQPMEIYYMSKEGIPVGTSTIALLVNLIGYQVATISGGIFSFIVSFDYIKETPILFLFFAIGIGLNITALILILVGVYSERLTRGLVNAFIKLLKFFRIKKAETISAKFEDAFKVYRENSEFVKAHPFLVIRVIILAMLQFLLFYSISYWTYRALGCSGASLPRIMTLQALVFAITSGIPSPGAVGVSEGAFIVLFAGIYNETMLKSATLLSRIISFYFVIIFSAFIVFVNDVWVRNKLAKERRATKELESIENEESA